MKRKTPRIASEAYQIRICSECWRGEIGICGALLKQLYGIQQGVVGHMDITIHGCLDGGMAQKLLKNFWRHSPFDGSGCAGMPKGAPCIFTGWKITSSGIPSSTIRPSYITTKIFFCFFTVCLTGGTSSKVQLPCSSWGTVYQIFFGKFKWQPPK